MQFYITLRPRQNGRHFTDDNFKRVVLNENARIAIEISLKFVPKGRINNIPSLVQIMAWRLPGDKPLSEPMMVRLPTHICVARPQWDIRVSKVPSNQRWRYTCHWVESCSFLDRKRHSVYTIIVQGQFYKHGLTWTASWISDSMTSEGWDEIIYPIPNLNRCKG